MPVNIDPITSIATGAITVDSLAANSITSSEIAASAIAAGKIGASAINPAAVSASVIGLETYSTAGVGVVADGIWDESYVGHQAASSAGQELAKIDQTSTSGLKGANNSLSYRINEIERHLHGWERWLGSASNLASADDVAALPVTTSSVPFVIDAGADAWGNWTLITGSTDTPVISGMTKYDMHNIMITDVERDGNVHFIQFGFGASSAGILASGSYTTIVYKPQATNTEEVPYPFMTRRQNAGTKCWARVRCVAGDTGTVSFFVGLHEYEG